MAGTYSGIGNRESGIANTARGSSSHRHHASNVSLARLIDDEPFLVLDDGQRGDERWQLARCEQIGGVSRTARAAPFNHIQVRERERLVEQHASRNEHLRQGAEDRAVEKADAENRPDGRPTNRQRTYVGDDAEHVVVSLDGSGDRPRNEIEDDDRPSRSRDRCRVASSAASDIDEHRLTGERQRAFHYPRRRRASDLVTALQIPLLPVRAVVLRIVRAPHR